MRLDRLAALCAGTILLGTAAPAMAQQTGAPAFRVQLGSGQSSSSAPPVYAWLESISECSSTCGPGTRTTSYQCQNAADFDYSGGGYGAPEADSLCTASVGPKPSSIGSSCTNYSGCGYDWVKPPVQQTPVRIDPNPIGRVGCGLVRTVFAPYCQRTGGGAAVVLPATDHRFCRNDLPDYNDVAGGNPDALGYDRNVTQLGSCNTTDHEWRTGDWGSFDNTCSNTATQTRPVTCYRKFDNQAVADASCDAGAKPAASQTQGVYTSCSYDWVGAADSNWGAWNSTCSTTATRTRNPQCRRSNGDIVADSECINKSKPKPATSQTQPIYDSCTYTAGGTTTYGSWGSTCSSNATRTVTRQCIRSNGDVVANAECTNRGVSLTSNQTQAVYDSCSYSYSTGGWSDWNSHCSNGATRTRAVTCMRSDGTAMSDAECANRGIARPTSSETAGVYDSCSYAAGGSTGYGAWNTTCSSNAQRTVTRQCIRSNGDVVASSECTNRGVAVTNTQAAAVYDGCGYAFQTGGWSDWNSHCSNGATRTRAVTCMRSDGTAMSDAECTNRGVGRPTSSETAGIYDGCSYAAGGSTSYGGWNTTCSANAQRTVTRQCIRSDGNVVSSAECTNRGVSVTSTQTSAVYDGCGYSFQTGGWSDWNSHCSASAVRTRAVQCYRSDGTPTSDAECTNRGVGRPASSETAGVYDGCGYYAANPGAWTDWNSHCSASAYRSRTYQCYRGDGTPVGAAECTNRGVGVTEGQNAAVYDGCGYSFSTGGWSDWNSHCSSSATRTRSVQCYRSDGTAMSDAECTNRGIGRPASSETAGVYDQCGYSAQSWVDTSACVNGTKTASAKCMRSDGFEVAASDCTARGIATTRTETCSNPKPTFCVAKPRTTLTRVSGGRDAEYNTQTSNDGTFWFNNPAALNNGTDNPCGKQLIGSATIISNGRSYPISASCTANGGPNCDSGDRPYVIDGVSYWIRTYVSSYMYADRVCRYKVDITANWQGAWQTPLANCQ